MSWEFLYPLIDQVNHPFRWWRTWLRIALSTAIGLFALLKHHKKNTTTIDSSISKHELNQKIESLNEQIEILSAQQRYREYQILLRSVVLQKHGVDLQSTSLATLKYHYTWLQKSFLSLLEQTYYYPYNQELWDKNLMEEHIQQLLWLIKTHES